MNLNEAVKGTLYVAFTAFEPLKNNAEHPHTEQSIISEQIASLDDFIGNHEDLTYQELIDSNVAPDALYFNDFNSEAIPKGCHVEILLVSILAWVGFPKNTKPNQISSGLNAIKSWVFDHYGNTFHSDPITELGKHDDFKSFTILDTQPTSEDEELDFHMVELF